MKEFESLIKNIKNKEFLPIYFLHGEEPFFIDSVAETIENNALNEEDRSFNQTIIYGKDNNLEQIVGLAKQFPMSGNLQVIIVKEAQDLDFKEDFRKHLENYISNIQPSTLLVFSYKYKKLDSRQKLAKMLVDKKWIFLSEKLKDYQLPKWIKSQTQQLHIAIDEKAEVLLIEFLGNELPKMQNELKKLALIVGKKGIITPEIIEKNIGFSKDFNNFELTKAISYKNAKRAFEICDYFAKNPKDNPLTLTTTVVFNYFTNLVKFHSLTLFDKNSIASELGINPYFTDEYIAAAQLFPIKKVTQAISNLRKMDAQSKGINATNAVKDADLLKEFLYKTIYN